MKNLNSESKTLELDVDSVGEGGGIAGRADGRVFDRALAHPGVGPRSSANPAHPHGFSTGLRAAEKILRPWQPQGTAASGLKPNLAGCFRQPLPALRRLGGSAAR